MSEQKALSIVVNPLSILKKIKYAVSEIVDFSSCKNQNVTN